MNHKQSTDRSRDHIRITLQIFKRKNTASQTFNIAFLAEGKARYAAMLDFSLTTAAKRGTQKTQF